MVARASRPARLEILAYAPTEFWHCQHCEVVWSHLGFGQRWHAEQRRDALPPDLQADYAAIGAWVSAAAERYGRRLEVRVIDVASVEGFWKALRYGLRRFPAFVVDGGERIVGFDGARLDAALAAATQRKEGSSVG